MSRGSELSAEGIKLHELERAGRLAAIEAGLERGHISLAEIFGSSYIFRALKPGINHEFRLASAPSYAQLYPDNRGVPRKVDAAYADYLISALGPIDRALVIGDTQSDFLVGEHLRAQGVEAHGIIVNPGIRAEVAADKDRHTWFGDNWGVLSNGLATFEEGAPPGAINTVMLVDIDKTVIGPRTTPIPGEKEKDCSFYIDEARRYAVSALARNRLLSGMPDELNNQLLQEWIETYAHVKGTNMSSSWDDEDTNAFLTAMVYFGMENIDSLLSGNAETAAEYLERMSHRLIHEMSRDELEAVLKRRAGEMGLDEDVLISSWVEFQIVIREIQDNIRAGIATPFESFRMLEYEALRDLYEQGRIFTNRQVVEAVQYGLRQGWRVYALSDKPDAAIGMPEVEGLRAQVTQNLIEAQSPIVD